MAYKHFREWSLTERAITTAQGYQEGFVKEGKEELDTDESLYEEDSDS